MPTSYLVKAIKAWAGPGQRLQDCRTQCRLDNDMKLKHTFWGPTAFTEAQTCTSKHAAAKSRITMLGYVCCMPAGPLIAPILHDMTLHTCSDPDATSSRNRSPVEKCSQPYCSLILLHCVPLPALAVQCNTGTWSAGIILSRAQLLHHGKALEGASCFAGVLCSMH